MNQGQAKLYLIAHRIVHSYCLLVTGWLTEGLMHIISCCHVVRVVILKSYLTVLVKNIHSLTVFEMVA